MKKRTVVRIKVEKEKRSQKRAKRHPSRRSKDPKDLRGAKGALLKQAAEAAAEEGPFEPRTPDQR